MTRTPLSRGTLIRGRGGGPALTRGAAAPTLTRGAAAATSRTTGPRGEKKEFGFRGLGNKEEIPHDLQPINWGALTMDHLNKALYNVRLMLF